MSKPTATDSKPRSSDRVESAADWPDDLAQVGHVLDAWGTQGWLKIAPESNEPAALLNASHWWMHSPRGRPLQRAQYAVRLARRHTQSVVALLDGTTTRTQAESFRGWTIYARREDFPPAGKDEYYWVDLIGCTVLNREGLQLGTVGGLIDNGAQTVLQVRTAIGDKQLDRLIPFVDAYVVEVDLAARRIVADWLPEYD